METITLQNENAHSGEVKIKYERRDDGWYVKTPENNSFWMFANISKKEEVVRNMIKEKWDSKYAGPADPLDDKILVP